jgi:hypothetical protein
MSASMRVTLRHRLRSIRLVARSSMAGDPRKDRHEHVASAGYQTEITVWIADD